MYSSLLTACQAAQLPSPEVGYELAGDNGKIIAIAELAWEDRKVAVFLPTKDPTGSFLRILDGSPSLLIKSTKFWGNWQMDKEQNNRMNIGPQYAKDKRFTARMRFHQSWYRSKVLRVPYGIGPRSSNTTLYGNMLTHADGERGLNFLTPHIFEVAKRRLAMKKAAIEPFRLFCNMLSSQPMCFNLFGPLVDDLELATHLVQLLLPGEIQNSNKSSIRICP